MELHKEVYPKCIELFVEGEAKDYRGRQEGSRNACHDCSDISGGDPCCNNVVRNAVTSASHASDCGAKALDWHRCSDRTNRFVSLVPSERRVSSSLVKKRVKVNFPFLKYGEDLCELNYVNIMAFFLVVQAPILCCRHLIWDLFRGFYFNLSINVNVCYYLLV